MERLNLDQAGARTGELYQHSLQLGDETVTLGNIATMAVEQEHFRPWDTPGNRRRLGMRLAYISACFLIGLLALAAMGFSDRGMMSAAGLVFLLSAVLLVVFSGLAASLSLKLRRQQVFYRLRIGTSDARQIDLVDDSRRMLEQVRDAIRRKIDEEDWRTTGHFDLNTDTLHLDTPSTE
ncbi:MAG: hypothetical protein GVY06_08010 [Alphaproteobacteria bacterium]|jgi:membrane protein implicated in regulation of membrane protease activity|nr:hypothetical protein [Alphaproteobacteria bacterium]